MKNLLILASCVALSVIFLPSQANAQKPKSGPSKCEETENLAEVLCRLNYVERQVKTVVDQQVTIKNDLLPTWSITTQYCFEIEPAKVGLGIGFHGDLNYTGEGHVGVENDGTGAGFGGGINIAPLNLDISGYEFGMGASVTSCIRLPDNNIEGPVRDDNADKTSFASTQNLDDILLQAETIEETYYNKMGEVADLIKDPINMVKETTSFESRLILPKTPVAGLQQAADLGKVIAGFAPIPSEIENLMIDPLSLLKDDFQSDDICTELINYLPNGRRKDEIRSRCREAPKPAEAIERSKEMTRWLLDEFKPSWSSFQTSTSQFTVAGTVEDIWDRMELMFPVSSHPTANDLGFRMGRVYEWVEKLADSDMAVLGVREQLSVVDDRLAFARNEIAEVNANVTGARGELKTVSDNVVGLGNDIGGTAGDGEKLDRIHDWVQLLADPTEGAMGVRKQLSVVDGRLAFARNEISGVSRQISGIDDLLNTNSEIYTFVRNNNIQVDKIWARASWTLDARVSDVGGVVGSICRVLGCGNVRGDGGGEDDLLTRKKVSNTAGNTAQSIGLDSEQQFLDLVVPDEYFLDAAYPNPSASTVRVQYGLPRSESVRVRVFDTSGREIRTVLDQQMNAGRHAIDVDVSGLASGTYFYRIEAGPWVSSKTISVTR